MIIKKYDVWEKTFSCNADSAVIENAMEISNAKEGFMVSVTAFKVDKCKYALRFMPVIEGEYTYRFINQDGIEGSFICSGKKDREHGPVCVKGDMFYYADGAKYLPFGTTCYAWTHQKKELQDETVNTLSNSCFNKLRMLIFPKYMPYNREDPEYYPFKKKTDGCWDTDGIVPEYWNNLDQRMNQLKDIGVIADLILFHPYDKWGFAEMTHKDDCNYLKYMVARYSAYSNVFWSLANEYEMLTEKTNEDFDEFGTLIAAEDKYHHPISIHNILKLYPKKEWMTHLSIQNNNMDMIPTWKQEYGGIPLVIDECGYEGNIEYDWGNLSAFDMTDRVWHAVTRGGYCTHGETFHREDEILWWSKGGKLYGESEKRIRFLKELLESLPGTGRADAPGIGFNPNEKQKNNNVTPESIQKNDQGGGEGAELNLSKGDIRFQELMRTTPRENMQGIMAMFPKMIKGNNWMLRYYGRSAPYHSVWEFQDGDTYRIDVIDTFNMTRNTVKEAASGHVEIELPSQYGMAVLVLRNE